MRLRGRAPEPTFGLSGEVRLNRVCLGRTAANGGGPHHVTTLNAAEDDHAVNSIRTDSAPQQQVANGWYTNDMLNVAASQNAEALRALDAVIENQARQVELESDTGNRIAGVLLFEVLALAWHSATLTMVPERRRCTRGQDERPTAAPSEHSRRRISTRAPTMRAG